MKQLRLLALIWGAALALCGTALSSRALTITVTNLADSGAGTLRQAIDASLPGGTITFDPSVTGTITLTSGELEIDRDLTITGPGANRLGANLLAVSGNAASRVFHITAGTVSISGLTISNGKDTTSTGGGGIYNGGTLTLTGCTLSGNSTGTLGDGGGIYNQQTLTLNNCTLSANSTYSSGGGIYNGGALALTACTLSANFATAASGGGAAGGGIFNGGTLALTACTLRHHETIT